MTPDLYHRGQIDKTPEPPTNTVGIDWLSMTSKEPTWEHTVRHNLARVCEGQAEIGHGRHNYTRSERWPCGATLFTGHKDSGGMLDLPGGACGILGGSVVVELMRGLLPQGRCTRLDIACDFYDTQARTLVSDALDSCRRGEFVGVRSFKHFSEGDVATPDESTGLYLGSTSSPRFVRIYDKGFEQGSQRGEWVRWEGQFRDDHADKAAHTIAAVVHEDWGLYARSIALHAVEFMSEPDETHNDRRDPVPWYADLVSDTLRIRTRMDPCSTTLDGFLGHSERTVMRTIKLAADLSGVSLLKALDLLFHNIQPTESTRKNPTVFLLAAHLRQLDMDTV